jgi:hypothetical protein
MVVSSPGINVNLAVADNVNCGNVVGELARVRLMGCNGGAYVGHGKTFEKAGNGSIAELRSGAGAEQKANKANQRYGAHEV